MATVTVTRENASALISPEESREIIQSVVENSVAMRMMTRLPNMGTNVREYPIMDSYPMAGFVDGDAGLKMTTNMKWKKDKIVAGEIAAIVAVPDNVVADSQYDIFGQMKPRLIEAAGRVADAAIFFGINKPAAWREGLVPSAIAAGNVVTSTSDIYKDIFDEGGMIAKVEDDGYFPESIVSAISMRAKLRGLRDTSNRPLFLENMHQGAQYTLGGMSMDFPRNGAWDDARALMVAGDWKQAVYAIRQDVTFDVFDSGVVSDEEGKVVYNLMQNDMKAIRMVIRLGWQILNPINSVNPDGTTRFPFAVYAPSGGVSVTPKSATVAKGGTQQFTAGGDGASGGVTWSVTGESAVASGTTVSNAGLLTVAAAETNTALTVKATSTKDTTKSGSAAVTVGG